MTTRVLVQEGLEFPPLGFVRIDAIDQGLVDLRASMK
jgi:hypothetical protein